MDDSRPDLKARLSDQWAAASIEWIEAMKVGGNANVHREAVLDSWMLDVLGDVSSLDIIDLGCGEGRFCRMLSERGARVTGVDLNERFVEYAEAHGSRGERYVLGDMEDLAGLADDGYDVAVSYITLVDVPDLVKATREAFRVLRHGGRFVVCNLHPMTLAGMGWIKHGEEKLHYRLDNYFDEGARLLNIFGHPVDNFHRTLSSYVAAFLDTGFIVEGIREPKPTDEQVACYPAIADNLRVPEFIIYLLRKP